MYTREQVDEMLLQVEQEFEKTLESIAKNEKNQEIEESVDADSEEFESIDDLYASMSKSEIEAHYNSIKKVMLSKAEDDEMEKKEDKMPMKMVDGKKVPAFAADGKGKNDLSKEEDHKEEKEEEEEEEEKDKEKKEAKEDKDEMEKCGDMSAAKKSEKSLVEENQELKKNLESLNELVSKLFNTKKAPTQKAITNASFIAKSEEMETESVDLSEMSKSEITSKLKSLDFKALSKSDRDAINNFYLQNGSVEKIKHLFSK